jgi:arabinofuranosyltransferase
MLSLRALSFSSLFFYALYVVHYGWVAEDAFISFRVVDNFVHGYGLRWNIDERVQVFTNPLWTLLHIPLYFMTGEIFYTTIFFGALVTMAAVTVFSLSLLRQNHSAPFFFIALLVSSRAITEYSTSGLENSLCMLLLALFYVQAALAITTANIYWGRLSFITALLALTRLDAIIFTLPFWLYLGLKHRRNIPILSVLLGMLPLLLWFLFCLFYYGFIFPNTKFAKLDYTGIGLLERAWQARFYFYDLVHNHFATFVMLLTALCITTSRLRKMWLGTLTAPLIAPTLLGISLIIYTLYIIYIGADHYSGRYWAVPAFAAAMIIGDTLCRLPNKTLLAVAALLPLLLTADRLLISKQLMGPGQIENARALSRGLVTLWEYNPMAHAWSNEGLTLRQATASLAVPTVLARGNAGMMPFFSGPKVIIIDGLGITDPLLARLPVYNRSSWYSGHYWRGIPEGYAEWRSGNQILIKPELAEYYRVFRPITSTPLSSGGGDQTLMKPELAEYYRKLRLITSAPLFSGERLKTIFFFQLGRYEHWRKSYIELHHNNKTP